MIFNAVFDSPTRICASIFASRIILHLRDAEKRRIENPCMSTAVENAMFADIEMEDRSIECSSAQVQGQA